MTIPRKIAIVVSGLGYGGAENSIANILLNLATHHSITVYVLQDFEFEIQLPKSNKINVVRINAKNLKDIKSFNFLRKLLKNEDLIIAHLIWAQLWTGTFCMIDRTFRKKTFWVEHNVYKDRKWHSWIIIRVLSYWIMQIFAVSEEVSSYLYKKARLKSRIIYNAISVPSNDLARSPFIDGKNLNFAIYGRLVSQKNPQLAIDSFLKFRNRTNSLIAPMLNIIGSGQLEVQLRKKYFNEPGISFLGSFEKDLALKTLSSNHVYLSTSRFEGFPLARFEALKLGLCVVSTRTSGYQFLLKYFKSEKEMNKLGIFFVDESLDQIIKSMNELMDEKYWRSDIVHKRIACTDALMSDSISRQFLEALGVQND